MDFLLYLQLTILYIWTFWRILTYCAGICEKLFKLYISKYLFLFFKKDRLYRSNWRIVTTLRISKNWILKHKQLEIHLLLQLISLVSKAPHLDLFVWPVVILGLMPKALRSNPAHTKVGMQFDLNLRKVG